MRPQAGVLAALAVVGFSSSAFAEGAPGNGAPVTAAPVNPGRARPAESGAHDTAATVGPLAIGVAVHDRSGALIGHVVLLTTDKQGRSVAKVREDEDTYLIPTDDLFVRGGETFSTVTLEQLRHGGAIADGGKR
jgi:hypothetical protein